MEKEDPIARIEREKAEKKKGNGFAVTAGGQTYEGKKLIIASGSSAVVPPIPGLKEAVAAGVALTNREILDLKEAPGKLIVLGGGVIGDMGGLAASLYMRGIGLVQLPTSLLAAVDSSVGGKTAIDLDAGKNLVGTFYQPDLVLYDTDTIATLPGEQLAMAVTPLLPRRKSGQCSQDAVLTRLSSPAPSLYPVPHVLRMAGLFSSLPS